MEPPIRFAVNQGPQFQAVLYEALRDQTTSTGIKKSAPAAL
jgi:hypothetical protein